MLFTTLLLIFAAVVVRLLGGSARAQIGVFALGLGLVVAAHALLPAGHEILRGTGGSFRTWVTLAAVAAATLAYTAFVGRMRRMAAAREADAPARGPDASSDASPAPTGGGSGGAFSGEELERYARHIVLREIGGPGQQRLKRARVLIVGAGGLGCPSSLYLAAAGVGTIGLIDDDVVSLSNLQRQVLYRTDQIGQPKVLAAAEALHALNPHVAVRPENRRLTEENAAAILADYDLVLDGTDTFANRAMVNRVAVAEGKPLVSGAIGQWEGQVTLFHPPAGTPCYACLFPEAPAEGLAPSCAEAGVVGALPGIVGSIMAAEAIKHITGAGRTLAGRMLLFDALWGETRTVEIERNPECPVCGGKNEPGGSA